MKLNYENIALYGLLGLVILILIISFSGFRISNRTSNLPSQENNDVTSNEITSGFDSITTGSTGSGDVSIELKPEGVENGVLKVDILVNTHSVSLDEFDLKKITTLKYNGKNIAPISASKLGGHHSSGTLEFKVEEELKRFTIIIVGIPKVQERIFEW